MWLGVYLLYCVLQESSGCTVDKGKGPDITGSVGDTVVLPCVCKGPGPVNPQAVQWGYRKKFIGGVYTAEHSVVSKDGTQNDRFKNRVQRPTQNPPGQVSLIISPLTEEDEGTYLCGNQDYNRAIRLYVGGCSMVGQQLTVTRSPGESVLLPCPCPSKGHFKPERVTWSFRKDQTKDETPVSNDTGSYRGRVRTFDQTRSRNLSLLISDLTKEDAGQYYCTSDQQKAFVNLRVKGCALVENKQTVEVNRSSGESVLLSCTCAHLPEDTPVTVQWRGPRYKDRVETFNKTSPGDLSVLISDLTVKDGGTYSCWINQNQYRTFTLTVKDCTLSPTQENPITRYPGQSVLLPCSCTDPDTRPGSLKWERVDPGGTEVSNETGIYSGRVQMINKRHPANLSLLISNLTEQDQGTYRCSINNQSINIRLSIKDCTLSQTQKDPITRYPGESVLLPCSCIDPNTRPPSVKWERVDSRGTEVSNETGIYSGRVQMFNKNHPANLSLLISDLTEQDQGTYRCSINQQSISIRLSITDCTLSQTQENQIIRYPGESVLLPCSCTDPNTRPGSVKWEMRGTEVSNNTGIYSGRVQMFNKNHPTNLSLLISNLTEQDQGTYRCSINNNQSISIRLSITGCTLSQTQENQIIRYPGESVLLPCSCTDPKTRPLSVKWEHVDSRGTEVSSKMEISHRVQMFNKSHPANLSLLISNLTEQDQGTYRCSINNNQSINIRLSITGCTLSQTQENQIIRYPGESVLLPCSCTDPNTRPLSVKWEHVDSGGTEGSSKMEISGRVQIFNKSHPSNLSLLISSLTEQDQGTYRCSINNNQSVNIRLSITGCTLSQTQENPITRYPGESVLLPCSCTDPNTRPLSVKWERVDSGGTEGSNKTEPDSDRVQMFNESHPANLSLLISNLTEQDQGTYRCSINNNQSITIRLSITGCTLSQTQENQIIRSPRQSVLLSCSCTDPKTRPLSVKWERVDSGGTEGSSKMVIYSDRVQMFNKSHPANLSLLISNLTEQDQGTYRCSINNNQSINIKLSITAGQQGDPTAEQGNWVIIIIICALLLILLLLLGGAACTYRKHDQGRKQRKDKDTGQRTNEEDITYTTVTHRGSGNKPQKQDNVIYSPVAHGKKDTPAEDDVTYSTLVHGKKGKTPPAKDDVTYASVAHGKDQQANTEDEVTYSSVVHSKKGKKPKGQKKAEEDVMYSDVAFCRAAKSGDQDQVTFSKGPEEPTLYASVKPGKK